MGPYRRRHRNWNRSLDRYCFSGSDSDLRGAGSWSNELISESSNIRATEWAEVEI